jgi:hypothetical protein
MGILRQAYSTYPGNSQTGVSVVAGDLIYVAYSYNTTPVQSVTCSDDAAGGTNAYSTSITPITDGEANATTLHVFFAIAKATETLAITCTAQSDNGIHVHVVSGMNQTLANILDVFSTKYSSVAGLNHVSSDVVTTNANDYIICFWAKEVSETWTENGTNFVRETMQSGHSSATFDRGVTSTGTYNDAVTINNSNTATCIIAAFKDAASTSLDIDSFSPSIVIREKIEVIAT